jgi:hypothetical protein
MMGALLLSVLAVTHDATTFPGAQPQIAGAGRQVGLVFGRGQAIYFAGSSDGGRSFRVPTALPTHGRLHLGKRRGPRVAFVDGTYVVTAILGEGRDDGDLMSWSSSDDGHSWRGPVRLNGTPGSAREGLHGMAAGSGLVAVVWLDLRGPGTRVFAAISRDRGANWSQDFPAYEAPSGSVCECCHPSVAVSPSGEVAVMFRNQVAGARDLYLVRFAGKAQRMEPAVKLGLGTWALEGCPMDGGSVVFDGERGPVTAWRRDREVFLARPGAPEERLGEGRDPVVAVTRDGATHAVWRQGEALVLSSAGSRHPRILAERGESPALLANGEGSLVAAWQQDDQVVVASLSR